MPTDSVSDDLYVDLGDNLHVERKRELLTAAERAIIADCAKLMENIRDVFHPNRNVAALLAFNQHVYAMQRMIMSNAAARAYPGVYKLLGED